MAPRKEINEKDDHDSWEESTSAESVHMVDYIDLDAVDFEPFFTNESVPLNYHTSDSPEHRMLIREMSCVEESPRQSPTEAPYLEFLLSYLVSFRTAKVEVGHCLHRPRHIRFVGAVIIMLLLAVAHIFRTSPFLNLTKVTSMTTILKPVIPLELQDAYRDVRVPFVATDVDIPVYWHVGAPSTAQNVISTCYNKDLVVVSEQQQSIKQFLELRPDGNVTSTMPTELERVETLKSANNIILTISIWDMVKHLNNQQHRGRLFAFFEDPTEQRNNVSSLQSAQLLDNYLVRTLVNQSTGPLNDSHLNTAKSVVREKFLVGLVEQTEESLRRIEAYFGWARQETCPRQDSSSSLARHSDPSRETNAWKDTNRFDLELYEFAKLVFQEQAAMVQKR